MLLDKQVHIPNPLDLPFPCLRVLEAAARQFAAAAGKHLHRQNNYDGEITTGTPQQLVKRRTQKNMRSARTPATHMMAIAQADSSWPSTLTHTRPLYEPLLTCSVSRLLVWDPFTEGVEVQQVTP